ncbi:MAG: SMC-Scp complex subunit ScpB [Candidatus Hadarchaeales archaeon]
MGIREDLVVLEGALYASDHPLTIDEIKKILSTESDTYVIQLLEKIEQKHKKVDSPFELQKLGNAYAIKLKGRVKEKVAPLMPKIKISTGALRTLALIAYKQNITLAKLAEVRGNRAYEHVRQLVAAGFVESKPLGKTRVLRTTKKFASYFGLEDDMDLIREKLEELLK